CCRGRDKQVHTALSVEQQTGSKGAIDQHHSERETVNASDFSDASKGDVVDLSAAERKPGDAGDAVTEIFNGDPEKRREQERASIAEGRPARHEHNQS